MRTVAIAGAGDLGASIGWRLARADLVGRLVLVDEASGVAAGKALDIQQAGPVERFDTRLEAATEIPRIAGLAAVVLADTCDGVEWTGERALALIERLAAVEQPPVVVCAGTSQRELIRRAVDETRYPRQRILGSSPRAAASAARAYVAAELDAAAPQVVLTLAGAAPAWAVAWSGATLGGAPVERRLTPPVIARIERRLAASWPPGPHLLAAAAYSVVRGLLRRSRDHLECDIAIRSAGREVVVAMPVSLDTTGVVAVHQPELTTRERVVLDSLLAG